MLLLLDNLFYLTVKHNTVVLKMLSYPGKIMIPGFWILLMNLGNNLQIAPCIIVVFQRKALGHSSVAQQLRALSLSYTAGQRQFKPLVCIYKHSIKVSTLAFWTPS